MKIYFLDNCTENLVKFKSFCSELGYDCYTYTCPNTLLNEIDYTLDTNKVFLSLKLSSSLTGCDICKTLKLKSPFLKIYLTNKAYLQDWLEVGFDGFLLEPFDPSNIQSLLGTHNSMLESLS